MEPSMVSMYQPSHPDDCALCKREIPKWFYAEVVEGAEVIHLCHRNESPTCYERWTVYGERPTQ